MKWSAKAGSRRGMARTLSSCVRHSRQGIAQPVAEKYWLSAAVTGKLVRTCTLHWKRRLGMGISIWEFKTILAALVVALLATACGGGGSDAPSPDLGAPPQKTPGLFRGVS